MKNIKDVDAEDFHLIRKKIINDQELVIEYVGGYEDSYHNELVINFNDFTYTSKIKDLDKNELAKVFNVLFHKFKFNKDDYKHYSLMELVACIYQGLDHLNLSDPTLYNYVVGIKKFYNTIGRLKIEALAKDFNDVNINDVIDSYYELYLYYAYRLFVPQILSNEKDTSYNPQWDRFFQCLTNSEEKLSYDDVKERFVETPQDKKLIKQYIVFVRAFPFQIENDLNNCFY